MSIEPAPLVPGAAVDRDRFEVSVVIAVYNASLFLDDTVRSALRFQHVVEVVLAEDASTDDSLEVCHRLAEQDPRVRVVRHPDGRNHGAAATFNLGIRSSTAPFVAILGADDQFLPNRFDGEREIFAARPELDGIYGALGVHYHSEQGQRLYEGHFRSELTTVSQRVTPEELFDAMMYRARFGHFSLDALTVRRAALMRLPGGLFKPRLRLHQDTEILLRLAYHAKLMSGNILSPVALRGVHDRNRITTNPNEAWTRFLLYDELLAWARSERLPERHRRAILAKYTYYDVLRPRRFFQRVLFFRHFIGCGWLLNIFEVRKAYFDGLFGEGSRASSFFQKVAWRLLNKVPRVGEP